MSCYKCHRCGYATLRLSNFKNHINRKFICKPLLRDINIIDIKKMYGIECTKKDLKKSSIIPTVSSKLYPKTEDNKVCEYCKKVYSSYKNKWRHQKKCKVKNIILDQHDTLKKQNSDLMDQVDKLIHKVYLLEKNQSHNYKNNNINSFNKIQVNNYGCENIDYITDKVFKKLLNTPLSAIPKLIELKYFNPDHPENHNVKITNIHDKFAKIYKDNKWLISHKKDVIQELVDNGHADFEEFKDLNEEEVAYKIKEKYKKMEKNYVQNVEELYKKSEISIINGTNKIDSINV